MNTKMRRVERAEKELKSFLRDASLRVSTLNAVLGSRSKSQKPNPAKTVVKVSIQALDYFDDDMRVRVNGKSVYDERQNVAWYVGETNKGPGANPTYWLSGFRRATLTASVLLPYGAKVEIDCFDGWGGSWRTAPWKATVTFGDGYESIHVGGSVRSGNSPKDYNGAPDYYSTGPHFEYYIKNGHFFLTR